MNHYMNKKELLDKAVKQFGGKWPAVNVHHTYLKVSGSKNVFYNYQTKFDFSQDSGSDGYWDFVCSKEVFKQRAKELGYVNGCLEKPVVAKAKSLLEMLNDLSEIEFAAVKDSDEAKKLVAYLEGIEHKRKAEAERKRVVDAAYKVYSDTTKDSYQAFIELYDMGMLVMPSKSS